jgi:O-acetyl-ADP-ribose deacetylase (regulator of RNase III)
MPRIGLVRGDITKLDVDVIVNAANSSLLGGGGVDGAIHRAAGPDLLEECILIRARDGGCKTGDAKVTKGYRLPAKHIIHTVGPVWRGGMNGEPELLASCYRKSLELAAELGARTIAFPAISTGIYGYPFRDATEVALRTIRAHAAPLPEHVTLCMFDDDAMTITHELLGDAAL